MVNWAKRPARFAIEGAGRVTEGATGCGLVGGENPKRGLRIRRCSSIGHQRDE
jgi:hypothetical protein